MEGIMTRHFKIYTRTLGNHEVAAQTKREAIARVVARLGLEEERCQTVNTWAVAEVRK
jgi:coenzyme F420-reducing hydrogenase delta subunit